MERAKMLAVMLVAFAVFLLSACGGRSVDYAGNIGKGNLALSVGPSASEADGVAGFKIEVWDTAQTPNLIDQDYVLLHSGHLPSGFVPDAGDSHDFASANFVLLPGSYHAKVYPMRSQNEASTVCVLAEADFAVVSGQTTTVALVSQCTGTDNGGVEIVAALNNPPQILNAVYDPSEFIEACTAGSSIEDLTTYIKKDDNNHLTVTATEILAAGVQGNEDVWVYKDFGVNHFDEVNINFEIQANPNIWYMTSALLGLENQIGGMNGRAPTDLSVVMGGDGGYPERAIHLVRGNGIAQQSWVGSISTPYYLMLTRAAGSDTATLKIYSDSERTALLSTLSVSGFGTTKWQYLYGFQNPNDGDGSRLWYGYSKNMQLSTPAAPPLTITFSATDPDGDALAWSFTSTPPLPSECSISDGVLTCPSGSLSPGNYQVTVTACDPYDLCAHLALPIYVVNCSS